MCNLCNKNKEKINTKVPKYKSEALTHREKLQETTSSLRNIYSRGTSSCYIMHVQHGTKTLFHTIIWHLYVKDPLTWRLWIWWFPLVLFQLSLFNRNSDKSCSSSTCSAVDTGDPKVWYATGTAPNPFTCWWTEASFKGMQSCGPLLLCGPCTARPHRDPFLQVQGKGISQGRCE